MAVAAFLEGRLGFWDIPACNAEALSALAVEPLTSLEQVLAAAPTRDYDGRYGSTTGGWTTAMFVEAAYRSLRAGR